MKLDEPRDLRPEPMPSLVAWTQSPRRILGCAGDLAAGADVGVEPAQIEPVDDGRDRTHLVIGRPLGVEVDPAPDDRAALRALDPHVALRLHRATRPGRPGGLVCRTGTPLGLGR